MANTYTGPVMMFEHCLDELKGWPDEAALDFDAFLAGPGVSGAPGPDAVNVDPVYGGTCVHVGPGGEFVLGVGGTDMGIFLLQGSHELDVNNYGGSNWQAIAPTGKMSGLVATGAFELETTEFDQTDPSAFAPGNQLTSPTELMITGADLTAAGKLFNKHNWPGAATAGTPISSKTGPVCAVCSRASHYNHHRVWVLSFWPVYVPFGS